MSAISQLLLTRFQPNFKVGMNNNNNNNNNNKNNNNNNNNINHTEDVNASGLYFRNLAYNCRKLKRSKLINDMDVTEGNITIKYNNGSFQKIVRREDLIGMFPAFQGFLFCWTYQDIFLYILNQRSIKTLWDKLYTHIYPISCHLFRWCRLMVET